MNINVIGLGHLGMVAAAGLAASGHDVTGLDVDDSRIQALREGRVPFYEPGLPECVSAAMAHGSLRFIQIDEFSGVLDEIVLITAGTPGTIYGGADMSQVRSALAWVRERASPDLVLVMKSTVPPGSGRQFLQNHLRGLAVDYVSNPEFLREGRALQDWKCPDRIVVGADSPGNRGIDAIKRMYAGVECPFLETDITSAEMIKYANNAFLATRISFINQISSICDAVGASIDAVSEALALDARTGSRVYAGVGYGGSCLPKDILALQHLAHSAGLEPDLLRAVAAVNNRQRRLSLKRLQTLFGGDLQGKRIGVLGLAFKPGTDDIREAASLDLVRELVERGAKVRAYDPKANGAAHKLLPASVHFVDSAEDTAPGAQALVLLTEWKEIVQADWASMAGEMLSPRFLFDGRNALDAARMLRLGFHYAGVGRGDSDHPYPPTDGHFHSAVPAPNGNR